jgi:predicted HTH domain antitoxin
MITLTLEVRTDFNDPIKHDAMREAVRIAARNIISTACLLQERQVPEITLYENTMHGTDIVNLFDEEEAA